MTKKYTAQCACGAVKFEFNTDPDFIANCHCLDCKKASGGEMATFFAVPQDDFTLINGTPKAHRYIADSGKALLPAIWKPVELNELRRQRRNDVAVSGLARIPGRVS